MDNVTMKDYLEDLVRMVEELETQFKTLNAVIVQLQAERDFSRALYEATREEAEDLHEHLSEALYCEEGWRLREYAIASYSRYAKKHHARD